MTLGSSLRKRSTKTTEEVKRSASEHRKIASNKLGQPLSTKTFFLIFFIRLFNTLTIKTYFQADEFYQSLEPAHYFIYDYGYITWEWKEGLRSSIHPMLYSLGYKLISMVSDDPTVVLITPKVIGSLLATIGEVYLYKFVQTFSKNEVLSKITLGLSLLSPFNWYFITRSFSNSLEMILTTIAFRYWSWNNQASPSFFVSCGFAFISCIVRPTNVLIWIYLGINFLIRNYKLHKNIIKSIKVIAFLIVELAVILLVNTILDYTFYGRLTFPLYNFLEFNVIKNLSIFYGVAPWHFYISQGVPLILLMYLPFLIHSLFVLKTYKHLLGQVGIFILIAFSLIDHKEIRFIYPLQPIFLLLVAYSIKILINKANFYMFFIPMCLVNVVIAIFFTQIHERGVIDVMDYFRNNPNVESFGFLTPCHSTPWQSHLHRPELANSSWFLTCEPPLHLTSGNIEEIKTYRDESDLFYFDPSDFLSTNFPPFNQQSERTKYQWPSHLVIFEPLEKFMNKYLKESSYYECERFFNSYFHWDDRRKGDLVVYCKN